ncbi:MAG: DUF4389 domain-containing protein [bacterium]
MDQITGDYPAKLNIDYSEKSNRLTVFFRIFLVIPIFIILIMLLSSGTYNQSSSDSSAQMIGGIGFVVVPVVLMILFRKKYPKWWFDWNLSLVKFSVRVVSYMLFLTDQYPSTDEEQAVHLELKYPHVENELNRWMPLIKWILILPHAFILFFLYIALWFCTWLAWFAIIFTGKYPKVLFDFVVGVMRWSFRVKAYAVFLITDKYPPFSFSE